MKHFRMKISDMKKIREPNLIAGFTVYLVSGKRREIFPCGPYKLGDKSREESSGPNST